MDLALNTETLGETDDTKLLVPGDGFQKLARQAGYSSAVGHLSIRVAAEAALAHEASHAE